MRIKDIDIDTLKNKLEYDGLRDARFCGDYSLKIKVDAALPKSLSTPRGGAKVFDSAIITVTQREGKLIFRIESPEAGSYLHPNFDAYGYWKDPKAKYYKLLDNSSFIGIISSVISTVKFLKNSYDLDDGVNRNAVAWCRRNLRASSVRFKPIADNTANNTRVDSVHVQNQHTENASRPTGDLPRVTMKSTMTRENLHKSGIGSPSSVNYVRDTAKGSDSSGLTSDTDMVGADSLMTKSLDLKRCAEQFIDNIRNRRTCFILDKKNRIDEVCRYINLNYPDFFESNTVKLGPKESKDHYIIYADYKLPMGTITTLRAYMMREAEKVAAEARKRSYGEEQLEYIYSYLVSDCIYKSGFASQQWEPMTAVGALVRKSATSHGFAVAFQLVAGMLGYNCIRIIGKLSPDREETYAWNVVEFNGFYYHIDAAYGACLYHYMREITYPYFMTNAYDMLSLRQILSTFTVREDPKGSYFRRKGLVFNSSRELAEILTTKLTDYNNVIVVQADQALVLSDRDENAVIEAIRTAKPGSSVYSCLGGIYIIKNKGGLFADTRITINTIKI